MRTSDVRSKQNKKTRAKCALLRLCITFRIVCTETETTSIILKYKKKNESKSQVFSVKVHGNSIPLFFSFSHLSVFSPFRRAPCCCLIFADFMRIHDCVVHWASDNGGQPRGDLRVAAWRIAPQGS